MKLYISGISGTGMGPLALMAKNAGLEVVGSDLNEGAIFPELIKNDITVKIGKQDGEFLREQIADDDVWFVHTSALPEDHPELKLAREQGLKISKRDDLTEFLVKKLGLKMVAVAGTHGKTTTTSMIVFAGLELDLPIAYIVGTTLGFAPSGSYRSGDEFFVYEADEYDRNFLKYHPWLGVIPAVSYDHPDIYPTKVDYEAAFSQFESQCESVVKFTTLNEDVNLAGEVRRKDANLALEAIMAIAKDVSRNDITAQKVAEILSQFPGVGRRFEKIADGLYSDYAHHPEEIAATIEIAKEEAELKNKRGIVAIYQPHQNTRQYEVMRGYKTAFIGVDKLFWLPTYITRENPELRTLSPLDLICEMENPEIAEVAKLNNELADQIKDYLKQNYLVIMMTAGPADEWLRDNFSDVSKQI